MGYTGAQIYLFGMAEDEAPVGPAGARTMWIVKQAFRSSQGATAVCLGGTRGQGNGVPRSC
jgi:hypothetical protein